MEDARIIDLYFSRSEDAIAQTRRSYGRMIRGVAWGILRSARDTEECESDTYLKAWQAMPPTRPSNLGAFLSRITRNLALDRYERKHADKRGAGEVPALIDELAECLPDAGAHDDFAGEMAVREALGGFIGSLGVEARRFFLRRYWFGGTIAEIAARYGCGEGKVKTSLMRSRRQLTACLVDIDGAADPEGRA